MTNRTISALLFSALLVACGGADTHEHAETSAGGEEHHADHADRHEGEHHEGEHHEGHHGHHDVPAELAAVHDIFHPIWHGEEATRGERACAHSTELVEAAAAHQSFAETSPEGVDAESYSASAAELVATSNALNAACQSDPGSVSDDLISAVHEPMHALMHAFH